MVVVCSTKPNDEPGKCRGSATVELTANCLLPLAKVQKVFAMILVFHLRCAQTRPLRLSSTSHFVFFPKNGHHVENGY